MNAPDTALRTRAEKAGLRVDWTDVTGAPQVVSAAVLDSVLALLPPVDPDLAPPLLTTTTGAPVEIPGSHDGGASWVLSNGEALPAVRQAQGAWTAPTQPGYWEWQQEGRRQRVAVAPARAFYPDADAAPRHWGLAAQVYSLRQAGDGGIGDSSGASRWLEQVVAHGGDALALSPIHAAMPLRAGYSPYSPSDRTQLEALHGAPLQVLPEAAAAVRAADAALDARLSQHEQAACIDWPAAAAAKQQWIDALPGWLRQHDPVRWRRIAADLDETGETFGTWLARCSWTQVQQQARRQGLAIGLIADLAVGFDPLGAEAQRHETAVLRGLELGAPPDAFNPQGQAWGITGYAPHALRAQGYAPFITLLRAVMADRGGIRIDHILGLNRLWVLPQGAGAGQGVYLEYPFADLINLLVLESWRNRCVVIGEDLGVVPPGIRATLAGRGILGIDVLAFSRDATGFWPSARWRSSAVAMTSTHDLPPVAGWLAGRDLDWHHRLGWSDAAGSHRQREERERQRQQLATVAAGQGLPTDDLHRAALAITARSPAPLALLPLEDALGETEQPNLPGTVQQHPNWQCRLPAAPDAAASERMAQFAVQRRQGGAA